MTDAYIYSLKPVLKIGPTDQQSDTLTIRTLGALFDAFTNGLMHAML